MVAGAVFSIHTASFCTALTRIWMLDFHIHSLLPFLVYINYQGLLFVRIHICEFNGTALLKITHTVNSSNLFMSNQSFFPHLPFCFIPFILACQLGFYLFALEGLLLWNPDGRRTAQLKGQEIRYKCFQHQAAASNLVLVRSNRSCGQFLHLL